LLSPPVQAQPSPWRELDTGELLRQAALTISALKSLNEDLKKQIENSLERSEELEAQLETLKTAFAGSERMRIDLVHTLKISQEYWKNYGEEAESKISKAKSIALLNGIVLGFSIVLIAGLCRAP